MSLKKGIPDPIPYSYQIKSGTNLDLIIIMLIDKLFKYNSTIKLCFGIRNRNRQANIEAGGCEN